MSKYYTPTIEEFHDGFDFEIQMIENAQWATCLFTRNWKNEDMDIYDWLDPQCQFGVRVKHLEYKDVESILDNLKNTTGKQWRLGKQMLNGYDPRSPWQEYILEDASLIYINEYLKRVMIERNFGDDRGTAMVFNGIIRNKSEFKRVLNQTEVL